MTKQPAPLGTVLREDPNRNREAQSQRNLERQQTDLAAALTERDYFQTQLAQVQLRLTAATAERDEALAALREIRSESMVVGAPQLDKAKALLRIYDLALAALSNQEKP